MRQGIERLCVAAAVVLLAPVWALYVFLRLALGRQAAFEAVSQRAARWPGPGGKILRRALLGRLIARMGDGVTIGYGSMLTKPTAELGRRVTCGAYCMFGNVRLGDNVMIADYVYIPSGSAQHGFAQLDVPMRDQPGELRVVTVGEDCWIGSHAVILADVGSHCIIGAGSVVTKPVPDYAIVAGNPAKPIGDRREAAGPVSADPAPPPSR
jgi:virginiamycin A acetyltransferase